jgi:tripartite-type tricarboxylate transporter receptor subunit TctC
MAEKPETKKWLTEFGGDPWVVGPAEAQQQILKDIQDWAGYVRLANIEPKG